MHVLFFLPSTLAQLFSDSISAWGPHLRGMQVGVKVPLIVRLEGTNVERGKKILATSGMNLISANDLDDAAAKAVASIA